MQTTLTDVNKKETKTGVYFPPRQRIVINNIREMLKTNCLNNKYTNKAEKNKELSKVLIHFC
jgi:hypothetical protein